MPPAEAGRRGCSPGTMHPMNFLLRVIINAVEIWFATLVLSGLEVVGGGDTTTTVIVNAVVKPIVKLLALPLYVLTLGLFTVIVNAAMLWVTSWLSQRTEYGLRI